jgi:hypothetical protein
VCDRWTEGLSSLISLLSFLLDPSWDSEGVIERVRSRSQESGLKDQETKRPRDLRYPYRVQVCRCLLSVVNCCLSLSVVCRCLLSGVTCRLSVGCLSVVCRLLSLVGGRLIFHHGQKYHDDLLSGMACPS